MRVVAAGVAAMVYDRFVAVAVKVFIVGAVALGALVIRDRRWSCRRWGCQRMDEQCISSALN
jgi:hypothetical protein